MVYMFNTISVHHFKSLCIIVLTCDNVGVGGVLDYKIWSNFYGAFDAFYFTITF